MPRLAFSGGAQSTRSTIANSQRRINYFPEKNSKDAPVPVTLYQRPGFVPKAQGPVAPVRGLFQASNGNGYAVIGQGVYLVDQGWNLQHLGDLLIPKLNNVSMTDNGTTALLVDNSPLGYTIDLGSNVFAQLDDPTGTFVGATRVDYIDTFVLGNIPNTNKFFSTLSNSITFDPLYIAGKSDFPDPLKTLYINRHQILLAGQLKSEIWYDAGNPLFPFAELPGAYIEHGIAAPYSIASQDIEIYWLGRNLQGRGMVMMQRGYQTVRISNHALEFAIRKMATSGTISDAIGYCYQQDGHVFYVLTFPTGNETWVYDASIGDPLQAWSQRAWTDSNGVLNRDRSNCYANINETNVVGDWQNGTIYSLDPEVYTDNVNGVVGPISCVVGFPHILEAIQPGVGMVPADGRMVKLDRVLADIEVGMTAADIAGNRAKVGLRWSKDKGKTFGNEVMQSVGDLGQFLVEPQWRSEGIGRDFVLELSHSIAGPAALNGLWYNATVLGQ